MTFVHYAVAALLVAAANVAMAIAEPAYTVVRTYDAFEVRHYEPYVVAEATVSGAPDDASNEGFRILAAYIFGKNQGARSIEMTAPVVQTPVKIAMTAPVTQAVAAGGYVMQFAMPSEWTLATLPQPEDPRVTLHAVPARNVAVIRYSGTWSQANYDEHVRIASSIRVGRCSAVQALDRYGSDARGFLHRPHANATCRRVVAYAAP